MATELLSDAFARHIGETFEVIPPGGEPFEVALSSCEETPYGSHEQLRDTLGRIPFSLIFHAAERDRFWGQQTFVLRHPDLGELSLFMVPLGPDERGMQYEAVIS